MPFPLAHPAAVLPLRRYCPRWFNFPALIIGSLSPDLGYCFDQYHVARFSHRLLAGSFGFCLPVGLLLVFLFYRLRRLVVQLLPARERQIFEPLCSRPHGSPFVIVISLLTGAWTHIFLDSVTHPDGWLVNRLEILRTSLMVGNFRFQIYELLYSLSTFAGVAWLAWAYLNWLEQAAETPAWIFPGFKASAALLLATLTLLLSLANHILSSYLALADIIVLSAAQVAMFFTFTVWALRPRPTSNSPIRHQQNVRSTDA